MPYVTDEIYEMLPIKDESIVISSYPVYNENQIYEDAKKELEQIIEFIVKVRTYKLENSVPKDSKIWLNGNDLIKNILKINNDNIITEKNNNLNGVKLYNYEICFEYDNSANIEKEKESLEKEKIRLENSIERRKKLLANENYVAKAPQNLVENEKNTLKKEILELEIIIEKLIKLDV